MNLFIFHRDLRIIDNTTLIELGEEKIIPIFIFNPIQIDKKKNKYFSNNSVQFMIESLRELDKEIKKYKGNLSYFYGDDIKILKEIIKEYPIKKIGFNYDYTPFAKQRDERIINFCKKNKIEYIVKEDFPLYDILNNQTLKKDGTPYKVYTPFKNHVLTLDIRKINKYNKFNFHKKIKNKYTIDDINSFYQNNSKINSNGGTSNGLNILKKIENFKDYNIKRDILTYETTFLGAHLHYNTISIRQVYNIFIEKLGKNNNLINQLIWRDFYLNITHFFPHVLNGQINKINKSFRIEYDKIKWITNKDLFNKWKNGNTGVPIVDAGMRQLNITGFQHNRCRMICASFLVKNLNIDWREGEKYYASKLVDYDPSNNSGGWQWTSGGGTDAQPYFRIFNPWTQAKKFDKDAEYIKKWIPELKDVPIKDILNWDKKYNDYNIYIKPIIDTTLSSKKTIDLYKKYLSN
jgi:deoxyribodipyrimidine photo-lyase